VPERNENGITASVRRVAIRGNTSIAIHKEGADTMMAAATGYGSAIAWILLRTSKDTRAVPMAARRVEWEGGNHEKASSTKRLKGVVVLRLVLRDWFHWR
jgi:hypothetical protein